MNKQGVRAIMIFFALLAFFQLFQQLFHPIKLAGLQGAFDKGEKPVLTSSAWFEGKYQQRTDHYLKYNTAFNGDLVRIRNQVDYSLFGKINTILTLGKENFIFDPNYILARTGKDLINDSAFAVKSHVVNKTLNFFSNAKIPVYICYAPNKANCYSEYLPEKTIAGKLTNRMLIDSLVKHAGIKTFDFDSWFLSIKDTSAYPLVPKYGAHWTTYGACLAMDSLIKQMNKDSDEQLAGFTIQNIEISDKAKFTDDDYLASLNLMIKWKSPEMAYPNLQFNLGKKPDALIISDSFIWSFYDLEIIQNCFSSKTELRYYNKTLFNHSKNNLGPAPAISSDDLTKYEYIIILTSDPGLLDFGYGFFEATAEAVKND